MKKILFSLIFASACIGATAQEEWKEVISRQDTLTNILYNKYVENGFITPVPLK